MKSMMIATAIAVSTFATAAIAHPVQQPKPAASSDFAKQLFGQLERDAR